MLIARRDQEAKSIPKMRDVKEISESHKFEHGLASPFVLSVHIIFCCKSTLVIALKFCVLLLQ
jgi:hypothetical protein